MIVIGLCGGSGSGKSTAANLLVQHGAALFDADAYYRSLVSTDGPCMQEICLLLGEGARLPNGGLNRPYVAARVFAPTEEGRHLLRELNQITHAYVRAGYEHWVETLDQSAYRMVVIDAPLLFEGGMEAYCYKVIAVVAEREVRISRIMARDGISRESAEARIASQLSDDLLESRADYAIDNSADIDCLHKQLNSILLDIFSTKG